MKNLRHLVVLTSLWLMSCSGWEYAIPTFPAPPPTPTPAIHTPTPLFITVTSAPSSSPTASRELTSPTLTNTATQIPGETKITATETALPNETPSPAVTVSAQPISSNIEAEVLGCNTSIDILHGMGEVTNAYVRVINNTGMDLLELCVTLSALDEGRVHPDKTICSPLLENDYQIELKLTVDSTYKQDTPIQIEITSQGNLLSRIGQDTCDEIGIFAPTTDSLMTPVPIP